MCSSSYSARSSVRVDGWEFLEDEINIEGRAKVVQLLVDAGTTMK